MLIKPAFFTGPAKVGLKLHFMDWIEIDDDNEPELGVYVLLLIDNGWNWFKGRRVNNGYAVFYKDGEGLLHPDMQATHYMIIDESPLVDAQRTTNDAFFVD